MRILTQKTYTVLTDVISNFITIKGRVLGCWGFGCPVDDSIVIHFGTSKFQVVVYDELLDGSVSSGDKGSVGYLLAGRQRSRSGCGRHARKGWRFQFGKANDYRIRWDSHDASKGRTCNRGLKVNILVNLCKGRRKQSRQTVKQLGNYRGVVEG